MEGSMSIVLHMELDGEDHSCDTTVKWCDWAHE